MLYNEAYVPLIGSKHPRLMGHNPLEMFPDFWEYFASVIQQMSKTGQTATEEATRLLMERHGFLEETFFTWKLIPIIGDEGTFLGVYGTAEDLTTTVIGERRTSCIRNLTQRLASTNSFKDMWKMTMEGLAKNDWDIPFALLCCDVQSLHPGTPPACRKVEVVGCLGVPQDHPLQTQVMDLDADFDTLSSAVREAVDHTRLTLISADDPDIAEFLTEINWGGCGIASKQLVVVPVNSGNNTSAALILGINPYRRYNSWYQQFVEMISNVLGSSMSKLRLSKELKYRAEIAVKNSRDFQRSEMRLSRFATRCPVGLSVTDLTGKVSSSKAKMDAKLTLLDYFRE